MSSLDKTQNPTRSPFTITILASLLILLTPTSHASYGFPPEQVTMDVVKMSGGGGTYRCPDFASCYRYVLNAEARGATHYCRSIEIKKNGKLVRGFYYQN